MRSRETRTKVEQKRCESCGKRLVPGRRRSRPCALRSGWWRSPQSAGRAISLACAVRSDLVRAVSRAPARCGLGRFPACAKRIVETCAVGAGPHGDPRIRAHLPAGPAVAGPASCRGAGCPRCAVGDGGGRKMRRSLLRHRRAVGRPQGARLHRNPPPGRRRGTQRRAVLAGAARRDGEPQRRAHALAARKRAVIAQPARPQGSGSTGVGRRPVPRPRVAAGPLEHRA